jgi:thiol-disulfide isomerase/thioredoxin
MSEKKPIVTVISDEDSFRSVLGIPGNHGSENSRGDKRVHVVDVFQPWCGPCTQIIPSFESMKINVDSYDERIALHQVINSGSEFLSKL